MTQPGGPAAINGFLYQILQHLDWLTEVSMSGTLSGDEFKQGLLILEPGDGGDAQARASGLFLVEQYKTRSNGTWSLATLMEVLRDLRNAVPDAKSEHVRYRFVTDGRPGRLEAFKSFLGRLNEIEDPDDLDNETEHRFTNMICLSDLAFLDHVATETRSKGAVRADAKEREVVFHLLRCFEMVFEVERETLIKDVEARLRPHVPDLGDESSVRERLIGVLMERLGVGKTKLYKSDLDAIFREVGLMPDRLRRVANLARTLEKAMRRSSEYLKYSRENDVREVPLWPNKKSVLLIAGDSGAGKSWQLARLMHESVGKGEPVVFVRAEGTAENILKQAANEIWQVALGETSEKTLQAISNFFREDAFQSRPPHYTIAVDDVQSIDVARGLLRKDWPSLGARLVLTLPPGLARTFDASEGEAVQLHSVGEFSIEELDALFKMYERRWAVLPKDLKWLLRKPVLAGLFLDLPIQSFQSAPQSEYEIFQAFWDRIKIKCNVGDTGIVVALAARVLQGKGYPLPREHWAEIGLNQEILAALESAGWLSCLEHDEVTFVHDRLLNWAVAQYFCRQFTTGAMPLDRLFACMADATGWESGGRFDYVAMDTLWLLSANEHNRVAVDQLVEKMESDNMVGGEGHYLYTDMLPTLGQRAVPVLLQRLKAIAENSANDYRIGWIGDAFVALSRQKSVDIRVQLDSLLQSASWNKQSVAVKALATVSDVGQMDRLWEIHQQQMDAWEHNAGGHVERGYQLTFAALRMGVQLQPQWLRDRILNADPSKERVSELGYLLSGLDDPRAVDIWGDVQGALMEKVPADNPRCLLNCVGRFADHTYKDFVIKHLSFSGNVVSVAALAALAILDPVEAIDRIADVDDEQRFFKNEWLPLLLWTDTRLTLARIRKLAMSDSRGQRLIEDYFEKRPADLDEETLGLVLRQLRERISKMTTRDVPWHQFPLQFLGRMCSPALLRGLQDEAGGALERLVVELACSRPQVNSNAHDHILEDVRRTLVLFAGPGISDLINQELESEHFWVRHCGLNWAWVCGNEGTVERLAAIARRSIASGLSEKANKDAYREFSAAVEGLAALGADEVLVEILSSPGWVYLPPSLARFRAHRGPMPKSLTDGAVSAMQNPETCKDTLRCSVVIAWLSGDKELILDVRNVLEHAEPKSEIALYACIALGALGDETVEFARMAERLAFTKENAEQGLNALIRLKGEGVKGLNRWLQQEGNKERIGYCEPVIRALYAHKGSRNDAINAAVELCQKPSVLLRPLYEIAAESPDLVVRERILEEAFAENSIIVNAPLDAMRGLAKYDTERTAEAIEMGLSNHPKIERQLCQLLVRVAPESAAEKLMGAAVALERESLSDAVGRALRRLDSKVAADAIVNRFDGTEMERKMICRIAGWLPVPEVAEALEQAAKQETSISVRRAALDALYRHREEEAIRDLYSEFRAERCAARRWAFFVAVVDTADPYLLTDKKDSLWLGRILAKDVPYAFVRYADEVLEKRKKEEQRAQVMHLLREGRT